MSKVRYRCSTKSCTFEKMIPRDAEMPDGTALVLQPCEKHERRHGSTGRELVGGL